MENYTKIEINVSKIVYRFLENNCPKIKDAYNVTSIYIYAYLQATLKREETVIPDSREKQFANMRKIYVWIKNWDAAHSGTHIAYKNQIELSNFLKKSIMKEACVEVMFSRLMSGHSLNDAIRNYIINNFYEIDEMTFDSLKKFYQRNWLKKEQEIRRWKELDEI